MRYPADRKARTRRAILDAAGRVFKRRGYQGGGVDAVMKEAGLTHGGFYSHFENKEALLAEAVLESMLEARGRHREWTAGSSGREWLRAFLDGYLSLAHREHTEEGCPAPALISELDRSGAGVKASFERGLRLWAEDVGAHLDEVPEAEREERALGIIAASVGAVALARAVGDADYAERLLGGARSLVLDALDRHRGEPDRAEPDEAESQKEKKP